MGDLQLLVDLHRHGHRQGPGGDAETEQALDLARVDRSAPLKVADIGCGTGASTLLLARLLNARIIAVDFLREFLDVLEERAQAMGVADTITTLACSMDNLPFARGELDMIWAEDSIYNIGFERGVAAWRDCLKPGGLLVASEITWLTASRPADLQRYWDADHPEIDVAFAKIRILERHGFTPIGYFVLPERCWLDEYFSPLQSRLAAFRSRNGDTDAVRVIINAEKREIALYEQYKAFYSYGFYIARKVDG
ncbi:MAG: class I SAM-dependent methyltransferase [Prochlorococcaceae cyanobacterium]